MSAASTHAKSADSTTTLVASPAQQYPPKPGLSVAFVYFRAQAGGDFFADVPFAWSAGELRRDGVRADLFEVRYERGEPGYNDLLDADLMRRLRAGRYGLVVVESCWQPSFIDAVHDLGAWICETAPAAVHPGRRVDFTLRHYTRDRQPLRTLVQRLRTGADLRGVPNLRGWLTDVVAPVALGEERPVPPTPAARLPFCPVVEAIRIGVAMDLRGEPPVVRKTLDTNDGCPFSKPVRDNPAFAGVELDAEGVTLAGCSFCFMGGDYDALPWRETVSVHLDQIATWQAGLERLDEVVLRDQHAIRYLPHLLRAAIARGLPPVGVLVPGRGDAILRYGDALREAAEIAAGSGFWFSLYLIGFESFSESQLQRYNKGVSPAEYAAALRELRALHRAHPDTFRLFAYGSSSFILWEPWASLDDLDANVRFIEEHGVARLSSGLAATRLRLYPNLPLYWRAKRDGLLVASEAATDRGAAQTGYAAEARWCYVDGRVAAVEELVRRLLLHTRAEAQVGVLKAAVAWGRRVWPTALPAVDAGELGEASSGAASAEIQAIRAAIARAEAGWRGVRSFWRQAPAETHAADAEPAVNWQAQAQIWRHERRAQAARAGVRAAQTVRLGAACNNRCPTCVGRHDQRETDPMRLQAKAGAAGASGGTMTITGREPTLVPNLLRVLRSGRGAGATGAEVVSNGRSLATPGVVGQLLRSGATSVLLKRHRIADDDEDRYVRAAGAAAQQGQGIAFANAAGLRWRALLVPTGEAPEELAALVSWAHQRGARGVQLEVRIDEVALEQPERWASALREARRVAEELGVPLHIEGD